jgi:RNA polymerase sigma-70 factor (sigma-E family)
MRLNPRARASDQAGGAPASDDVSDSFEEFVRGRSAHLFQLALLLTDRNQADAQDLVQVALERAWARRRAISRSDSPEPYVRRVLVNASIDRRRWLRRRAERPLEDAGADVVGADDPAGLVARRDLLVRSLAALPPRQRAVLVLRYWEDLPETEVAATLGCSVGTVKSQASRGLARLRELAGSDAVAPAPPRPKEAHDQS